MLGAVIREGLATADVLTVILWSRKHRRTSGHPQQSLYKYNIMTEEMVYWFSLKIFERSCINECFIHKYQYLYLIILRDY